MFLRKAATLSWRLWRQGIQLNALAEGVALTEASDLPADQLIVRATTTAVVRVRVRCNPNRQESWPWKRQEILGLGAMASPMIGMKGPAMLKRVTATPAQPVGIWAASLR